MSRATVRLGICAFLGGTQVTNTEFWQGGSLSSAGLVTLFRSPPKLLPGELYGDGRSGAVGVLHIGRQTSARIGYGGPTGGKKRHDYTVKLAIYHRARTAQSETAQDDLDALVDAVIARLEADRTFGGCCWQGGEAPLDLPGITVDFGEPLVEPDLQQVTQTYAQVTFTATEIVTA